MLNGIGDRIRNAREKKKMTIEALAARLGISPQLIYDWENGVCEPDTKNADRLAKILSVTCDYILFGIDNKSGIHTMFSKNTVPEKMTSVSILNMCGVVLMFLGLAAIVILFIMSNSSIYSTPGGLVPFLMKYEMMWTFIAFAAVFAVGFVLYIIGAVIKRKHGRGKRK